MKYVTHFTKTNILLNEILPKNEFLFNSLAQANDPYESKKRNPLLFTGEKEVNYRNVMDTYNYIEATLERKIKVGCFVKELNEEIENIQDFKSIQNFPLWAHYGDNNNGVAIIFNKETLIETCNKIIPFDWAIKADLINYTKDLQHVGNNWDFGYGSNNNLDIYDREIFKRANTIWFNKDCKWSYEEEFRIMLLTDNLDKHYIDIANSIEAIIFGEKVSNFLVKLISPKCKERSIICAKMKFDSDILQFICKVL